MTDRTLIVARLRPGAAPAVARLFADSDRTRLPRDLGVVRRHLFEYHGLYFHYVEFDGDSREALAEARDREDFGRLSADLEPYVSPYDPEIWRGPADAVAGEFYAWTREDR